MALCFHDWNQVSQWRTMIEFIQLAETTNPRQVAPAAHAAYTRPNAFVLVIANNDESIVLHVVCSYLVGVATPLASITFRRMALTSTTHPPS